MGKFSGGVIVFITMQRLLLFIILPTPVTFTFFSFSDGVTHAHFW